MYFISVLEEGVGRRPTEGTDQPKTCGFQRSIVHFDKTLFCLSFVLLKVLILCPGQTTASKTAQF